MNQHYLDWHGTHTDRSVVIKSETMLTFDGQAETIDQIAIGLGMQRKDGQKQMVIKRINNCGNAMGQMDFSKYTERKWVEGYTPELINLINANVDRDLMDRLGYPLEDPDEFH